MRARRRLGRRLWEKRPCDQLNLRSKSLEGHKIKSQTKGLFRGVPLWDGSTIIPPFYEVGVTYRFKQWGFDESETTTTGSQGNASDFKYTVTETKGDLKEGYCKNQRIGRALPFGQLRAGCHAYWWGSGDSWDLR